jgi:transcription-repair coupling factor (superfamily II helicase)
MYCQMLERAVQEMKGETVPERRPPSLHLGVDIKVPESYLRDAGDRLALYKRIAQAADPAEIDRLRADTEDRFGHLPPAACNLFELAHLRLAAEGLGIRSVDLVEGRLQIRFHDQPPVDPARIIEITHDRGGSISASGMLSVPVPPAVTDRIRTVTDLLRAV